MAKKKNTTLSAYILLDRSGSMGGARWENAIGSINTYVESLRKQEGIDAKVTVAAFDSHGGGTRGFVNAVGGMQMLPLEKIDPNTFTVIREAASLNEFKMLEINELSPRGGTPLYDSTAKLINMAEKEGNEKTVIIIMTDGEENSSREYTLQAIRDRIGSCQKRGWEVLFLGAEFNVETMARDYGIGMDKVVSTRSSAKLKDSMNFYATASASYTTAGAAIDTTTVKANLES